MVKLEKFIGEIALATSISAEPLIEKALVQTAIDFCDETKVWKDYINVIALTGNVSTYDLCADDLINVVQVEDVYFNGERITPIDKSDLPFNWKSQESDEPRGYFLDNRKQINFYPSLNELAQGEVTIYCSLKPHRETTALPDILADDWYDAMIFGTKARLHSMRRMDFYDVVASRESRYEYKNEKTRAKNLVNRSFVNKDVRSKIRPAA